jgi:hypothetical protein
VREELCLSPEQAALAGVAEIEVHEPTGPNLPR